ncbi:MAG: hypothetical protein ACFNVO_11035, partial [Prevotella sp.]
NAVHFGAKRKAKSINIHCKEIGKTFSNHRKHGSKWAKNTLKSRFLVVKRRLLGLRNYALATKLERQNGAKCRFCS